jgi:adenylyltransferase/sulfurtransferase
LTTRLNARANLEPHHTSLTASNALSLLSNYDIILDCTDNAPTRYLLSDAAVRLGKPLVSGAAQKFEGQLCVYNLPLKDGEGRGPCYRCLFPVPPKPESVGSCEEVGILGAVTGIIGTMQALETVKIIAGLHGESVAHPVIL